ncbi:hypothetical protein Krac_2472 [Ktedonobacter racemifer DSM 44963]|uniref:Uncharacterized protein n=1 Tax=Ktedonobacter racemifer DSM 44963 TaxID=485913 RepID=D6U5E7_KTERA|nr:hypothetical protein Krac_2472 [Ktedonobacter racemifer DSM 44963]
MEGWPLLGPRFHPPTRWNSPVSSKPGASCPGTRQEADGSLRVVYTASIRSCRPCPLREQCQWQGSATKKPRQVSVLLHPLAVGSAPLLWRGWSRREHRRACMQLVRHQRIEVSLPPPAAVSPGTANVILSRPQRAHYRLSWQERLARNARVSTTGQVTIRLFGVPDSFAASLGLVPAKGTHANNLTNFCRHLPMPCGTRAFYRSCYWRESP